MTSLDETQTRVLVAGALVGLALVIAGVKLWEIVGAKPCDCHDEAVEAPAADAVQ